MAEHTALLLRIIFMLRSVVLTSFILITFLGCGSSSSPVVNDSPRSVLPPDNSSELIGTEDHPCDSSGGCFNDLVCEDGICVAPPVVDSGSSDGSSTGGVVDSGSSDGSSDGSSTGDLMDSGTFDGNGDGSSTGSVVDSGSSDGNGDGSSTGGIVDSGSSDGNSDGSSTGDEVDAGPTDCITGQNETVLADGLFRYVENASFDNVDVCEDGPLDWAITPLQSTNYSLRYDGEARGNIMEVDRSIMTGSGHWAFMQQSKELFVNNCSELVLSGEVNPIFQSLNSPGSTQGEFPVHVRVIYEDVLGDRYMYQVGVHYKGTVAEGWLPPLTDNWGYPGCPAGPCAAYETFKVNESEWYTLPALDVMSITPQPHKLLSFRLGSSGHRFTAKFDNVQLTGSDAETCGTENETEATSTTDAGITDPESQMDAGVTSSVIDAGTEPGTIDAGVTSSVTDAGTEPGTTDAGVHDNGEVMSANSETSKLGVSQNQACAIDATGSLKCWRFVGNLLVGWESEVFDL
jgi:hypothetical protein